MSVAQFSKGWMASLAILDLIGFLVATYIAGAVVDKDWTWHDFVGRVNHSSFVFIAIWIFSFYRLGLYRRSFALSVRDEFYYTIVALTLGVIPQLIIFTIVPALSSSRLVLLLALIFAIVVVSGMRASAHALRAFAADRRPRRIALVTNTDVGSISRRLDFASGTRFLKIEPQRDNNIADAYLVEQGRAWIQAAQQGNCDTLIVTQILPPQIFAQMLQAAQGLHIKLVVAPLDFQCHSYTLHLERSGSQMLLVASVLPICGPTARLAKRLFDLIVSALAATLCLPIAVLAALAIFIETGNPVLFLQDRVGQGGRVFKMMKFRTMRRDAGLGWATCGDARVTKVGAFLRRTSLDEIPQLVNVLRGEMSLIGPRPEMKEYADQFMRDLPRYSERHLVPPGITGWSQINLGRLLRPEDAPEVLRHDLFYIEHWSFFLDMSILLKTLLEFLFQKTV